MVVMSILPWRGCGGGHVWGDWEPTDRWEVVPFHDDTILQSVQRQYERCCQRSDCHTTETEWRSIRIVDSSTFNEQITDVAEDCEATYECPNPACLKHVEVSNIDSDAELIRNGHRFTWTCPECRHQTTAWNWERVEDDHD